MRQRYTPAVSETKIGGGLGMRIMIRTDDGRFLRRIDAWTGSPKVIVELTDKEGEALLYPSMKRADEDVELLNGMYTHRKIRRAVVEKYGEVGFMRVSYEP